MDDVNTYPNEFPLYQCRTDGMDQNRIIAISKEYSFSDHFAANFYFKDDLEFEKKSKNAQKKYATQQFEKDEFSILLYDWTVFGSGKQGFYLTNKRLFYSGVLAGLDKWSVKIVDIIKLVVKDKEHGGNDWISIILNSGRSYELSIKVCYPNEFARKFSELLSILKSYTSDSNTQIQENIITTDPMSQAAQPQNTNDSTNPQNSAHGIVNDETNEITKKCQTVAQLYGIQIPDTQEYKIDLSECTEEVISLLPGVGLISAKKFVKFRNQNLESISVEQFLDFLDIHECYREPLRSVLYCKVSKKPRGRRVDM